MKKAYKKLLAGLLGLSMICTQGMVGSVFAAGEAPSDIYYFDFEDEKRPVIEGVSSTIVEGYSSDKAIQIVGDNYGDNEGIAGVAAANVTLRTNQEYEASAKVKLINSSVTKAQLEEAIHLVATAGGLKYYHYPMITALADGWYNVSFTIACPSETEQTQTGDFYFRTGLNNLEFIVDDYYIAPKGLFSAVGDGIIRYNYTLDDNDTCGLNDNEQIDRTVMYQPGYGDTGAAWKLTVPQGVSGAADLYATMRFTTNTEYKFSMKMKSLSQDKAVTDTSWVFFVQPDMYNNMTATALGDGWYLLETSVFTIAGDTAEADVNISIRMWNAENHNGWECLVDDIQLNTLANETLTYSTDFDNNGDGVFLNTNDNCTKTVASPGYGDDGYAWNIVTAEATESLQLMADVYGTLDLTNNTDYTFNAKLKLVEGAWDDVTMKFIVMGDIPYSEKQVNIEELGDGWYNFSVPFTTNGENKNVVSVPFVLRMQGKSLTYLLDDVSFDAQAGDETGLRGDGTIGSTLTYTLPAGNYYYLVMGSADGTSWASLQNGTATGNIAYTIKDSDAGKYIRFVVIASDYTTEIVMMEGQVFSITVALPAIWAADMAPIVSAPEGSDAAYIVALAAYNAAGEMTNINLYTYSAQNGLIAQGTPAAISNDATSARAFVFESFANLKPCCDYAEIIK